MSDKKDSDTQGLEEQDGHEWHLEFTHMPEFPYPFPIVPAGTRDKHNPVGHLSSDGRIHVFNSAIVEQLVRAGLRARVEENGTKSDGGNDG
jgi:hypothetical protein